MVVNFGGEPGTFVMGYKGLVRAEVEVRRGRYGRTWRRDARR